MIKLLTALAVETAGGNGCGRHGQAENLFRGRHRGSAADRHDIRRGAPAEGGHAHPSSH